jgi:hypothetical protein
MRERPSMLGRGLRARELSPVALSLPEGAYVSAFDSYTDRAKRRAARPVRSRWWWPAMTGRR